MNFVFASAEQNQVKIGLENRYARIRPLYTTTQIARWWAGAMIEKGEPRIWLDASIRYLCKKNHFLFFARHIFNEDEIRKRPFKIRRKWREDEADRLFNS